MVGPVATAAAFMQPSEMKPHNLQLRVRKCKYINQTVRMYNLHAKIDTWV
jgi:hypothetical protein